MREASDLRRQLLRALAAPSAQSAFSKDANQAVARANAFLRANLSVRKKMFPPRGDDPALVALRVAGEAFGEKAARRRLRDGNKRERTRRSSDRDGTRRTISTRLCPRATPRFAARCFAGGRIAWRAA
jgi:hypothetical protein